MNTLSLKHFATFVFLISCTFLGQAQPAKDYCKQVNDIARMEMRAQEKIQMRRFHKTTASNLLEVVYHRCEWNIDPAVRAISGTVTTYFLPKTETAQVVFDLADTMVVDEVKRNGVVLSVLRTKGSNTVVINLGTNIPANVLDSVSIKYHGVPPNTGFGSFTQTTHAGVPVLWTLSEPYGAMDWWPCKNTLDDKIDSISIFITCPKQYKGISNGLRQSEVPATDTSKMTTHWKHRYPMVSYLAAIAVTNYQEFNNSVLLGATTLPMQTFCYPESFEDFKSRTQSTLDAMQLFHFTFGDYPFIKEKYGHTQFSWGGGEEHQTNSFVQNPGESLCAHELAHQWFGDKITCGSWEDIWLNEGFATHLASMFMEMKHPEDIYSNRRAEILNITSTNGGSVKVDDTLSVARIFDYKLSYLKGSHLLYMLRFKLGTETFLRAVRTYQKDPRVVYGFAKTNILQEILEKESGVKLDSFFRQWFVGQGFPRYNVQWSQIGNQTVKIKMNQMTSHPSVPFFQLPVALKFKNANKDTTVVVDNVRNGEMFVRNIGFIADSVIVDPEYWLICKDNRTEKLAELDSAARNVVVYPNPFENEIRVELKNFSGNSIDLVLYDVTGKTVFSNSYSLYQGREFISIPTPMLASGRYILSIIDETKKASTISLIKK